MSLITLHYYEVDIMSVLLLENFPIDLLQDKAKFNAFEAEDVLEQVGRFTQTCTSWEQISVPLIGLLRKVSKIYSSFKEGQTFNLIISPVSDFVPPVQSLLRDNGVSNPSKILVMPLGGLNLERGEVTATPVRSHLVGGEAIANQFSENSLFAIPEVDDLRKLFTSLSVASITPTVLPESWKDKVVVLSFTKSREDKDADSSPVVGVVAIIYSPNNPEDVMSYQAIFWHKEVVAVFSHLEWLCDSSSVLDEVSHPFPDELPKSTSLSKYLFNLWSDDQKFQEIKNANLSTGSSGVSMA